MADPPVLPSDTTFGISYIDPEEFVKTAQLFGVVQALPNDRNLILAYCAAASRWLESETGMDFQPQADIEEQHDWDPETRRLSVNNPPVLSVSVYEIWTGANTKATFDTALLVINNQLNYIELTALTVSTTLTPLVMAYGIYRPFVRIVYKSQSAVRPNIKLATGYLAAILMNSAMVDAAFPAGVKSISVGGSTTLTRDSTSSGGKAGTEFPAIVRALIAGEQDIVVV
jgi:hypothetical protein